LILGGSRGGFLGFLWLLLVLFVRSRRKLTFAVVSSILLIVAWFCAPPYWRERMLTIRNYQTDESAMGRVYLWHAAQGMVKHNPLTGIGIGNFEDFARDYGARTDQVAHNTFFHIMGEQGLLGLSAYFLYLATIWRASMRWAREGGKNPLCAWMANGIGMGYLVFVMPSYFVALSYYAHTYIPAAVLSAGDRIYRAKDAADEAPKARAR
jgi:O-antigen ligase